MSSHHSSLRLEYNSVTSSRKNIKNAPVGGQKMAATFFRPRHKGAEGNFIRNGSQGV